jgi:hypothetical protein
MNWHDRNILGIIATVVLWMVAGTSRCTGAEVAASTEFLQQVTAHFNEWDRDRNGSLSADEIERAVADPKVTDVAAAAAVALRRAVRMDSSIAPLSLEQISRQVAGKANGATGQPHYLSMYAGALAYIRASRHEMFVSGLPRLDTLGQGHLGDCFLLAGLGAFVDHDPARLKEMMRVLPDGTVEVNFTSGQHLVLPAPSDGEIALGSRTRHDGVWGPMFEKAVGTVFLDRQKTARYVTPLSIVGVGGSPHTIVELVTGHRVRRSGCEAFQSGKTDAAEVAAKLDEIRGELVDARKHGKLIVGGTAPMGKQAIVPGLYYNHSYAILDYDRSSDLVTFWNPIGNAFKPKGAPGLKNGYETSYGRFKVPLPEAVMWFGSFSIETDLPLESK